MNLIKATDVDLLEVIIPTLVEARKRYKSSDFLNTFPWTSTKWYKVHDLEFSNIESLYIFWDGSAWGEHVILPRTLKQGANDFRNIAADISNLNYSPHMSNVGIKHLTDIIKHRHNYRNSSINNDGTYLILVSQDTTGSPLLIIDGNHRAVAAMWRAIESGDTVHIPKSAWLGISDTMSNYCYYKLAIAAALASTGGSVD